MDEPRTSSQIQLEYSSEVMKQIDDDEQLQQTSMATFTSATNDACSDAECEICHQSITIADLSDHMMAHDLQDLEKEDQPTENKSGNDNETHYAASDSESRELEESLCTSKPQSFKNRIQVVKQKIGRTKFGEVVKEVAKEVSEINREDIKEVFSSVQKGLKELKSDTGDMCKDIATFTIERAKDWLIERTIKNQTLPPFASENLIRQVSQLAKDLNIHESCFDRMCTDEHILNISQIITNWKHFAYELQFHETDIEEIEMERKVENQRLEMLRKWKQKCFTDATYRKLLIIFFKTKRKDCAYALGRLLLSTLAQY